MIADNLAAIEARICAACARAGRDRADVALIAVSKTFPASAVSEAYEAGQRLFGENYVQDWRAKAEDPALLPHRDLGWHFIGKLQRNKIKYLLGRVACIQTVDRWSLAAELSRRAEARGAPESVLLQVNLGAEPTKAGFAPDVLRQRFEDLQALPGIQIQGVMAIPPFRDDPEETRPDHQALRSLRDELGLQAMSSGMSSDFEVAIEEGATIIRVGTAIFGTR
ncbi:MAG: YggS family pyridoxal phosphate-dependent enzyme [Proteobacteria bacterium]|nr:YggS family pyridoxal phosphate-dependent enzyme [Pseudomonadota bacterium]